MKIQVHVRELDNLYFNNMMFFYIFVFEKNLESCIKCTYTGSIKSVRHAPVQVDGYFKDEDIDCYKDTLKRYKLIHEEIVENFFQDDIKDLFVELMPEQFL